MACFAGKKPHVRLQAQLIGALIGLARATDGNEHLISAASTEVVVESLLATQGNGSADDAALKKLLERVETEKRNMVPDCFACACPCGKNSDYNMDALKEDAEDIRNLKSLILHGIRGMAASVYHAAVLGYRDEAVERLLYKALIAIGMDGWTVERLLPIALEVGEANLKCEALLDQAHTERF